MAKRKKYSNGFIVHPFETDDNRYHASYGRNKNKTVRSFKTLKEAKRYLAKHNVKEALYDSPSGDKTVYPVRYVKRKRSRKSTTSRKKQSNNIIDKLLSW